MTLLLEKEGGVEGEDRTGTGRPVLLPAFLSSRARLRSSCLFVLAEVGDGEDTIGTDSYTGSMGILALPEGLVSGIAEVGKGGGELLKGGPGSA